MSTSDCLLPTHPVQARLAISVTINRYLVCLGIAGVVLGATPARADVAAAARAFSDGQAAQLDGNYERAAQSFELAFDISPSKEALRSAIRARKLANQLPRAAMLSEVLLGRYGDDITSSVLANEILAEAKPKLGRVTITCPPGCTLAVGGRATSLNPAPSQIAYTVPGHQSLSITFAGDKSVTREVTVRPGDDIRLVVESPSARPVAQPANRPAPAPLPGSGVSPYWVAAGAAVTVGLAGATTWSGLDTKKAHDAYVKAPTHQAYTEGRSKQLRTNILLGAAAGAAITTTLVGVLWTRWGGEHAGEVALAPQTSGGTVSYTGRF